MIASTVVDDAEIVSRLESLPNEDKAAYRTNPFAVAACSGDLVTADEVQIAGVGGYSGGFTCPKCKGLMRHCTSNNGTPFFSHISAKRNCPSGRETPAHLCIKRGLHSVGFDCEVADQPSGYIWDAMHGESGVVAEVVCSGLDRYRKKLCYTADSGITCWWILDSASKGLCSKHGSERVCLKSFTTNGTIVVENLFKAKAIEVFSAAGEGRLFAFYLGLVWRSLGGDRWQLLDQDHALSIAAIADDGIKHLMVKMHARNAHVVTENRRRGIDRKTWFDRTFRYRGKFSLTWGGDREYVLEMVGQLIRDIESTQALLTKRRGLATAGQPSTPSHATAEKIVSRINGRHSASADEIAALRAIAAESRVTRPIQAAAISQSLPSPFVVNASEREAITSRSAPFLGKPSLSAIGSAAGQGQPTTNAIASRLVTQSAASGIQHLPSCRSPRLVVLNEGRVHWNECLSCGSRSNSWFWRPTRRRG